MKLKELLNLNEFASSGGGDGEFDKHKVHDVLAGIILDTVSLSPKEKTQFKEALEISDVDFSSSIISKMKEVIDWYNDSPDDIELSDGWYEDSERPGFGENDLRLDNEIYQALQVMYDTAHDNISHKVPNFPYEKDILHKFPAMKDIMKKFYAEFPVFAAAVKRGESNYDKVKHKYVRKT